MGFALTASDRFREQRRIAIRSYDIRMPSDYFYPTEHLTLDEKQELCRRAHELCERWWVDVLDSRISTSRQRVDMDFASILAMLDSPCHFVIIERRPTSSSERCLEVGFRTMRGDPEYFLWIVVNLRNAQELALPGQA